VSFWRGEVYIEKVRQIGTGTLCAYITDPLLLPFNETAPAYFEATLTPRPCEELFVATTGECRVTNNAILEGGPVFVGCYLDVLPDLSTEGIKWGQAVSNSTLAPVPIPGFETGSFWSVQVIWE
jgi:hypothetical protein